MKLPPFCPNPHCRFHDPELVRNTPDPFYEFYGTYMTKVVGQVQRFHCLACGKSFGERTFLLDYYTKKTLDYQELMRSVSSGECLSSMAKAHRCSIATLENRLERLSRNGILFHVGCLRSIKLWESLSADGFESFDVSEFHPNNIDILVGTQSQFLYAFTHYTLRRKGRMTEEQRAMRAELERRYKPPKGAAARAFTALAGEIPALWNRRRLPVLELKTDEHRAYPIALKRVAPIAEAMTEGTFVHRTFSSKERRTIFNPLFPVNYYDRELRKDLAAFHRESLCFNRNAANALARLMCHLLYHNYFKEYRVKWGAERFPSHAEVAGVDHSLLEDGLRTLFTDRLFYTHYHVSDVWRKVWAREYRTPLKKRAEYLPKFARVARANKVR